MRAVVIASCLSACSYLAVTPPGDPPRPAGDCTTSFIAPGLDLLGTIGAGAFALLGTLMFFGSQSCTGNDCGALGGAGVVIALPATALTVAFGMSTGYGHRTVDRCVHRHAREERDARKAIPPEPE